MAFKFHIEQAKREDIYSKVALTGSSGAGKTFTALTVATGMANKIKELTGREARIAMGNTEESRGKYYANEFNYEITNMSEDTCGFSPETFCDYIDFVVAQGFDILIIDSTTPEWEFCCDLQLKYGGDFKAWKNVTPRHNMFLRKIASSPIHLICTTRGKDQYVIEKNDNGKNQVKKLGVGGRQRDGFEYEFTCTFMLDQETNYATVQKDNTHLFDTRNHLGRLTETDGEKIIEWCNSDSAFNPKVKFTSEETENLAEDLKIKIADIKLFVDDTLANTSDSDRDTMRNTITDIIKQFVTNSKGKPSANFTLIKDIDVANNLLEELKKLTNTETKGE